MQVKLDKTYLEKIGFPKRIIDTLEEVGLEGAELNVDTVKQAFAVEVNLVLYLAISGKAADIPRDVWVYVIKKNSIFLGFMPWDHRSPVLCDLAIEQDGDCLGHVPDHLRTRERCLRAVTKTGQALCFVPKSLRDKEMCTAAVKQDAQALRYVPDEIVTQELIDIAYAK